MVDMRKVFVGVLFLIIFIILIFQIVGNTSDELIGAADSITDANNCSLHKNIVSGESGLYNFSNKHCIEGNSSRDDLYLAGQIDLPLNTLFGRGSILLLIFMAAILVLSIVTVLKGIKQKQ